MLRAQIVPSAKHRVRRLRILTVVKHLGFPIKVRCVPYVDTVVLFFLCLPKGMLKELRFLLNKRRQVIMKKNDFGKIVALHQPTKEALLLAEKYRVEADGKIYRVDFSYDLYCSDPHFNLENFVRQNVALKSRVDQRSHFVPERADINNVDRLAIDTPSTMYWRLFPTTTVSNLAHYNDNPGKVENGRPEHLEMRIVPSKNCRAAGLMTLHDVIDADPRSIFDRHVEIIKYDFESLSTVMVRKAVQQERQKHLSTAQRPKRSALSERLADTHRSRLKNRVASSMVRAEMPYVQTAKRLRTSSGVVRRMSRYPSSIFAIPNELRWGAKPQASLKHKKKID
jgi:hypothetical protein